MPYLINCPSCASSLRISDTLAAGSQVRCPKCQTTFTLPAEGAPPTPPPPPSPISFPDEPRGPAAPRQIEPGGNLPVPPVPSARDPYEGDNGPEDFDNYRGQIAPRRLEDLSSDYPMEVGQVFQIANSHFKVLAGPMFGYALLMVAMLFAAGLVTLPCAFLPLVGPLFQNAIFYSVECGLSAGLILVPLAQMKGKSWSFGDFFRGFQWWGWLILNRLYFFLVYLFCVLPGAIIMIVGLIAQAQALQQQNAGRPPFGRGGPGLQDFTFVIVGAVVSLLGLLPVFYAWLRTGYFSTALIVDRGCNSVEAIQGSWVLSSGHQVQLLLLSLAIGGIGLLSALPGIGIMASAFAVGGNDPNVTLPIFLLGYLVVIFGLFVVTLYASALITATYLVATRDQQVTIRSDAKAAYSD
jgi:predicted Zn finger-like uncharacterized protein